MKSGYMAEVAIWPNITKARNELKVGPRIWQYAQWSRVGKRSRWTLKLILTKMYLNPGVFVSKNPSKFYEKLISI